MAGFGTFGVLRLRAARFAQDDGGLIGGYCGGVNSRSLPFGFSQDDGKRETRLRINSVEGSGEGDGFADVV